MVLFRTALSDPGEGSAHQLNNINYINTLSLWSISNLSKQQQGWVMSKGRMPLKISQFWRGIEMDLFQNPLWNSGVVPMHFELPRLRIASYRCWSPSQLWFSSIQMMVAGLQCGIKMGFLFYDHDENSNCSEKILSENVQAKAMMEEP